jgi:hypothetical protein
LGWKKLLESSGLCCHGDHHHDMISENSSEELHQYYFTEHYKPNRKSWPTPLPSSNFSSLPCNQQPLTLHFLSWKCTWVYTDKHSHILTHWLYGRFPLCVLRYNILHFGDRNSPRNIAS